MSFAAKPLADKCHPFPKVWTYLFRGHNGDGILLWYADMRRLAIALVALHRHSKLHCDKSSQSQFCPTTEPAANGVLGGGEGSTRTFTMVTDQGWGPQERLRILGFRKKKTIIDVACDERGEDNEVLRVPGVWTIQRGGGCCGSVATAQRTVDR